MKILSSRCSAVQWCLVFALALFLTAAPSHATTVVPPDFDELVTRADAVFTGEVTEIRSEFMGDEGQSRKIVSHVSFKVLRVMKGQAVTPYSLRMLGGTVGNKTMAVAGAPKFAVGDRVILFVKDNGKQFFPTVGIMHGVYLVQHASASDPASAEMVLDHHQQKLESVDDIGKDTATRQARHLAAEAAAAKSGTPLPAAPAGLTREQFETAIAARVQALHLH